MLKRINEKEFNDYIDFAYTLAMNKEKCCYPIYYDGIKTKDDFYNGEKESFKSDDSEILLYIENNTIEGWINYYFIEEDKYIQISTFSINKNTNLALDEFIQYINNKFHGYELYLGFPEDNKEAINYLSSKAELIESSFNNILNLKDIKTISSKENIIKINKDNYHYFKNIHTDLDLYWTAERIYNKLDKWDIYVKVLNDTPVSAIFATKGKDDFCEIFGYYLEKNNKDSLKELLETVILNTSSKNKHIIFFEDSSDNEKIIEKIGFTCIGKYLCYKITTI